MRDEETFLTTTGELQFTPPPLYGQHPRHFIPSSYLHIEPRPVVLDAFGHPVVGHPPETNPSAYPFTPPTQHITPPTNIPPMSFGPRFSTARDGAVVIRDDNMVTTYIDTRLRMMGKHHGDKDYEETVQKAALDLISTARLTTEVFLKLRSKYLFNFTCAESCVEDWLPPAFSSIEWGDVSVRFTNLLPKIQDNHHRIPTVPLRRSRIPTSLYRIMCEGLQKSILRVGHRLSLRNEGSVSAYIGPVSVFPISVAYVQIFDQLTDLFYGRMMNHPEMTLDGQIGRKGRREYSYVFIDAAMLLVIELKLESNSLTDTQFSHIVAQVIAESDGRASCFFFPLSNT